MWKNLGRVFEVKGQTEWMHSHAMVPTPFLMKDRIRIFFSCRNTTGKSHIGSVDLDRVNPTRVLGFSDSPILAPGSMGTFDDSGVTAETVVVRGDDVRLYYIGWNQMLTTPYRNSIGLAISRDGGEHFERYGLGPIVERNLWEPYFCTSPWVIHAEDGWHMWYAAITEWVEIEGKKECLYHIKYAHSDDGVQWQRPDIHCIVPKDRYEANVRPSVVRDGTRWRMWYCYRGSFDFRDGSDSYRLGYAESNDGKEWTRMDEQAEHFPPRSDWDSCMQAYPAVLEVDGRLLMFYNGNSFGAEGFGLAERRP
jgi:predicted GH43/DUF377 family glycosyl hydrolase